MKYLVIASLLFLSSAIASAGIMTQEAMEKIVISRVEVITQKKGNVVFMYKKVKMALVSDVGHDRMRIIAPITEYPVLTSEIKDAVMESNFHSALDARYAVSKDVLYSAYIHPMSSLTKQELESALNQVSTLALTFGSTYSSGALIFNGKAQKPTSKEVGI